jgi:hypothetical protein
MALVVYLVDRRALLQGLGGIPACRSQENAGCDQNA